MSMEPSSWVVPCYSGWSMEEATAWSSDHRISFQTSLPSHSDSVQLQVVEYASPATPTHNTCSDPIEVFEEATQVFNDNYFLIMGKKMHRFPPSLVDTPLWYKEPVTVAIGPHHHRKFNGLLEAEQVKHAAANQCIKDSTRSLQEMYNWVSSVSPDARNLYYHDDVATFSHHDDFVPMMFFDACFLVQFMRWHYLPPGGMHEALESYFSANHDRICTDILMLENQIPWVVVKAILDLMQPAPSPSFCPWKEFVIAMIKRLKNQKFSDIETIVDVDLDYEPPHLLGLVWSHIVGKNKSHEGIEFAPENKTVSLSISVAELADVGIKVVPPKDNINARLVDMRLKWKWGCFQDLIVPPLCLTEANATWLINMAAFELCNTPEFDHVDAQYSAVCSYLHLFAMLMDQEKHVHELRENHVIEGGGLASKETLKFFTSIGKNMRPGKRYLDIIMKIEKSKEKKRSYLLKPYRFCIKHWTKIMAVVTVVGAVIGILSSLQALKPR